MHLVVFHAFGWIPCSSRELNRAQRWSRMALRSATIMGYLVPSFPNGIFIFVNDITVRSSCGVTYEKVSVMDVGGFWT